MTLEEAKKIIYELDSSSGFFSSDYEAGFSDAQNRVLRILDEVDAEPVGNPDKMTLEELAHELRKIFKFDILTYSAYEDCDCYATYQKESIILWQRNSPEALPEYDATGFYFDVDGNVYALFEILNMGANISWILDLSEYADENGNIDYSKCIVEVSDASE